MFTFILTLLLVKFASSVDTMARLAELDGLRYFYAESITNIQVDKIDTDRIFVSAGIHLYQLNGNLELEAITNLTSESVSISLSDDGTWLVVCMADLSCEIYYAANLSDGPLTRRPNATISAKNVALFAAGDRFYTGSISLDNSGAQRQILLNWYGYSGNQRGSGTYVINRGGFERNFYDGFVKGSNAYYFGTDNNPVNSDNRLRNFKVMRVCHNSSIGALYELSLGCGGLRPRANTRISGISVVEDFAGMPGTTIVLSRSRPRSTQNFICLYSLQVIDTMMQAKFNDCFTSQVDSIKLAWRNPVTFCAALQVCTFSYSGTRVFDILYMRYS